MGNVKRKIGLFGSVAFGSRALLILSPTDRMVEHEDDFLAALRREEHRRGPVLLREQAESIAAHARAGRRGKQRGEKGGRIAASTLELRESGGRGGEEATGSTLNPSRISIQCSQRQSRSRRSSASNLVRLEPSFLPLLSPTSRKYPLSDFVVSTSSLFAWTVKKRKKKKKKKIDGRRTF